jgi:hypothetical protein
MEDLLIGLLEAGGGFFLLLTGFVAAPLEFLDLIVRVLLALGQVGQLLLVVELHLVSIALFGL